MRWRFVKYGRGADPGRRRREISKELLNNRTAFAEREENCMENARIFPNLQHVLLTGIQYFLFNVSFRIG